MNPNREVMIMNEETRQHIDRARQQADERKPFVVPQLRREAELTRLTAERTFTFQAAS